MDYTQTLKHIFPRRLHPHLGTVHRRLRSLPFRTHKQWRRLMEDPALGPNDRRLLGQVESRISPGDGMYAGSGAHYFKVGLSAVRCIEAAIDVAKLASVKQALDLPCGHGRVLRFLVKRFPDAAITASDLDRKGVDFCARMFRAEPVYSQLNLSEFSLGRQFDLIWCGSLVTHLDAGGIRDLICFFFNHLSPNGVLVFTTHGQRAVQRMVNQEFDYGITRKAIASLIDTYREKGFGFADYPGQSGYGVSLTAPEWIRRETEKLGLKEIYFREHGWDDHQDVYGFVKQS